MRVLILGSMPGEMSLRMQQYYAHRQNAFWKIMGELTSAHPGLDYAERVSLLQEQDIGLWDVMQSCQRSGSLDSAIENASIEANDLKQLYTSHPSLSHVFFNGIKAEEAYRRHVLPTLEGCHAKLVYQRLPSTSPAHASMPYAQKLDAWRQIFTALS